MKKENQLLIGEEKSIYTDCMYMYLLISNRLCTQLAHDRKHLHRDTHTDTHTHTHTHTHTQVLNYLFAEESRRFQLCTKRFHLDNK